MSPRPSDSAPSSAATADLSPGQRWLGSTVILLCTWAMLWPALGPLSDDSFPLSTYPMFSRQRGKPVMHKLVGYDQQGASYRIQPELLGTSEVLQAKRLIDRMARKKKRARARFCTEVLERAHDSEEHAHIETIEMLRVRFDPLTYFVDGPEPIEQKRLGRCGKSRSKQTKRDASNTTRGGSGR